MPTRDILFPMLSYPTRPENGSIESAASVAAALGAHISGLTFELDVKSPVGLYAHPVNISGIIAAERAKSASNARDLIATFDSAAKRQGATHEHTLEHCTPGELGQILVLHARLRDLCIFPASAKDREQRSLLEALIFESGRPVLLLPEDTTRQLPSSFGTIAVAWDHSRSATRAVADVAPVAGGETRSRRHRRRREAAAQIRLGRRAVQASRSVRPGGGVRPGPRQRPTRRRCARVARGRAQHRLAGDGRLRPFETARVCSRWSDPQRADPPLRLDAAVALDGRLIHRLGLPPRRRRPRREGGRPAWSKFL
jgi:hypothetical protein